MRTMKKLKIGIIDLIGLPYDGDTLNRTAIGGSENAVISLSKELVKIGFDVTVLNNCNLGQNNPGFYDNVEYCPISELKFRDFNFDIVISQRATTPFSPEHLWEYNKRPSPWDYDYSVFEQLRRPSQIKVVWLHDTFCWGDYHLEEMVVNGSIDQIFCLSDWHTNYTTHSVHGPRRNIEVLKKHIFQTRNAVNVYRDWIDVRQKDINHYVYNASVNKGMIPLMEKIWPELEKRLPNARLTVIGGYHQYPGDAPDDSVKRVWAFQERFKNNSRVQFTGLITQKQVSDILTTAGWLIYPGAFPETFGISILEALYHNVPVLGCKFGAMQETATDLAGYFINYAIEPNSLFPNIDHNEQVKKFIDMVLNAAQVPYLYQQKQYACNRIKDVATWDTVALQWKQHFYSLMEFELSQQEKNKVDWINYRVHSIFGRRFSNNCEIVIPKVTAKLEPLPQPNVKLAFIDIPGMSYDGSTLSRRGLGGSESAVILMAKQLATLGFDVTIFNGCNEDDSKPGTYDRVVYRPITDLQNDKTIYDVVISSRTVMPFVTEPFYNFQFNLPRKFEYDLFKHIRSHAKLKVFWMHDTFSWGDDTIETLVTAGTIDEIWCLSDFHYHYVMNCDHGRRRNYEVLRDSMWITRNGITTYFENADLKKKDPNQFFFNANMSKGLRSLLNDIWPRVLEKIPEAKLKVIGGFYKLGTAFNEPNSQESEFLNIITPHKDNKSIEFTGVISQKEVARIASRSSYFIYPAELPETYGISTLESLYAQTPLITNRFGALEETATNASWMIDYAIIPNGLYPHINGDQQKQIFASTVIEAYFDKEGLKKKQEECLKIKELASWDIVALEWKQHLFKKLGLYISRSEFQKANYTVNKYREVTGRRITSAEQWVTPKLDKEKRIVVISPFYNVEKYIENCILSVAAQDYDNYEHWLIDDCSTDNSVGLVESLIDNLPKSIKSKFHLIKNETNHGAVYNQINTIRNLNLNDDDIVMLLDGDDSLRNNNDIFDYYNHHHETADFIYGSCWSMVDRIPLISQPYPPEILENKNYKQYKFNWNVPYTHLRTFKYKLIKDATDDVFQDDAGNWFKAGGDISVFYKALETADSDRVKVISDLIYNYNDINPINDYKVNGKEQTATAKKILGNIQPLIQEVPKIENPKPMKRILIAIPTNRNIEAQTFKSIYDLEIPDGYKVDFQYFWGYQVEQVRNLIAHWIINYGYDYLFSVDSDIAFAPDTLKKFLSYDKDMVTGLYIQRIQGKHCVEVMRKNQWGGVAHVPYEELKGQGLVQVDGCGFGCVLIKRQVFDAIPYPHFVYKSAIDHANTISEDVYFCQQARARNFEIWADTGVLCDHIGSWTYKVEDNNVNYPKQESDIVKNLRRISTDLAIPKEHVDYLQTVKTNFNFEPKVIYDIGANVLHWTTGAKKVWKDSNFYAFEAMEDFKFLYEEHKIEHHIGLLSDQDGKELSFYENKHFPGGNSYYRENSKLNPDAEWLFDDAHKVTKIAETLDTIVAKRNFPPPELIKMDIQGAELDVLKGAQNALKTAKHLILELQQVEYNIGAPLKEEVIAYLESIGYQLISSNFSGRRVDSIEDDYHFIKIE